MPSLAPSITCHGIVKYQANLSIDFVPVRKSVKYFCQKCPSNKRQKRVSGLASITKALELDFDLPDIDLDLASLQDDQGVIVEVGSCIELGCLYTVIKCSDLS